MHMLLSDSNLRAMISWEIVGTSWPYDDGTDAEIEAHLEQVISSMGESSILAIEATGLSNGYRAASFVDAFYTKRNGSATVHKENIDWINGIAVYLCKLAPIATFGKQQVTRSFRRGWFGRRKRSGMSWSDLEADKVAESPDGDWQQEIEEIKAKLDRFGFLLPSREELNRDLAFESNIQTDMGGPAYGRPYRVFDAIFQLKD